MMRRKRVVAGCLLTAALVLAQMTPAYASGYYNYSTIGVANKSGFYALGARNSFYISGGAQAAASNQGRARTIESTWIALSDGGDSLLEWFAGVSGNGEWGLTRTTPRLVLFVYYPGSATAYWAFGAVVTDAWHQIEVHRSTPASSWWVVYDGIYEIQIAGLYSGYIADVATGNETYLYSGEHYDIKLFASTGSNPQYETTGGTWVNGYPGGWKVQAAGSYPLFGYWNYGVWVNGVNGYGVG